MPFSNPLFEIVLYQPEIPSNAGNIIRLAANTGCRVHLVRPLGFSMTNRQMHRAGLDYHAHAAVEVHASWEDCKAFLAGRRVFGATTRGAVRYDVPEYREGDALIFGPETRGLPDAVLAELAPERRIRLPMREGSRSLNLSNAVAVLVYEAWRQIEFRDGV